MHAAERSLGGRDGLPGWPSSWYVVARSSELPRRGILSGAIADRPFVLFRTSSGRLGALNAHCPHMGTHLRHGEVVGEHLRCPLHHWEIDLHGACRGYGSNARDRSKVWPVAERFGLVLVFAGAKDPPSLPAPDLPDDLEWITAQPIDLNTSWHAMIINGFDILHLRTVHRRELIEPPQLTRTEESALRLSYVSRVMRGSGVAGWATRWIARNRIRVQLTCFGPLVIVESDLGRTRTAAVIGLIPIGSKVRAFGAFGVPRRGPLLRARLLLARQLYMAFLKNDFKVLEGMRLSTDAVSDPGVRAVSDFLRSLPEVRDG